MSTVQSLIESANPWQSVQSDASKLASKWAKSGLLEGLGEQDRTTMAMLLENQAKQLVVEASQTGTGGTFTPGTGEQWAGVALPLVRKVFGQIASKEFVSVQPMSLPAGLVFFLDFQYGTAKSPFASGNSLYGATSTNFGNFASGGLYGAGRYGYTMNQTSSVVSLATASSGVVTSASFADIQGDANFSASQVAGGIKKIVIATSVIPNYDSLGVGAFVISAPSNIAPEQVLPQFTKINGSNIEFFVTASSGLNPFTSPLVTTVFYNKQTDFNARGDFEDGSSMAVPNAQSATTISIPEINVQLRSETIAAKTRKLKAQWTPEFAQDLNAYHSLDAEAELTSILSEYISLEIDLEILDMLIEAAPTVEAWSAQSNRFVTVAANGAITYVDSSVAAGGYYNTQGGWFQTLGTKMQKISNTIHQRTLRGGANFLVTSPSVSTILESIPGFAADTDGAADTMKYAFGVQKVGQLNSRYKVYKNPYMTENVILMGFRGNQFLETGAVYAPYVPLIMTPLVYDPSTFTPRKGIMTRYAKKMVRPEFYGKIYVLDLNTI
jgi:hypothetical protein